MLFLLFCFFAHSLYAKTLTTRTCYNCYWESQTQDNGFCRTPSPVLTSATDTVAITSELSSQLRNRLTALWAIHQLLDNPDAENSIISKPRNCLDLQKRFNVTESGIYKIYVQATMGQMKSYKVYCDMHTDGGGWLVLQKRFNGSEDFARGLSSYRKGFGSICGEFWLGLDLMHLLTSVSTTSRTELRIDMTDWEGRSVYAKYKDFLVGSPATHYRLENIGEYEGNAGDGLTLHKGFKFTTIDNDQDESAERNCARVYSGAWWFKNCFISHLNGPKPENEQGIQWYPFKQEYYSLRSVSMKIRPLLNADEPFSVKNSNRNLINGLNEMINQKNPRLRRDDDSFIPPFRLCQILGSCSETDDESQKPQPLEYCNLKNDKTKCIGSMCHESSLMDYKKKKNWKYRLLFSALKVQLRKDINRIRREIGLLDERFSSRIGTRCHYCVTATRFSTNLVSISSKQKQQKVESILRYCMSSAWSTTSMPYNGCTKSSDSATLRCVCSGADLCNNISLSSDKNHTFSSQPDNNQYILLTTGATQTSYPSINLLLTTTLFIVILRNCIQL